MSHLLFLKRSGRTQLFLSSLSYRDLLTHLCNSENAIPNRPMFLKDMALKHNSLPLFQISSFLGTSSQDDQLLTVGEKKLSDIECWAFSHLHMTTDQITYEKPEQTKRQIQLVQALQSINSQEKLLYSRNALQRIERYLPNYFDFRLSHENMRKMKQLYLSIVKKAFWSHENNLSQVIAGNATYRLFSASLFNICDRPLIEDFANNYILPILPQNDIRDIQMSLIWISRFNLHQNLYSQTSLKTIKKVLLSPNSQINEKLAAINCIFLIVRKIYPHHQPIHTKCFNLIQQSDFMTKMTYGFKEILNSALNETLESRKNTEKLLHKLSIREKIDDETQKFSSPVNISQKLLKNVIMTKIFRGILLYLYYCSKNTQQTLQNFIIKGQILENEEFCEFLINNLHNGDFSAEIIYFNAQIKKINKNFHQNLSQNYHNIIQNIQKKVVPKYNQVIFNSQNDQSIYFKAPFCKLKHFETIISLQNMEILQGNVLASAYDNSVRSIQIGLLNENDFLSRSINRNLRNYFKEKIEKKDLRNTIKDSTNVYPFFPDLFFTHRLHQTSKSEIFIKNSFSKKNRYPFWDKETKIFDIQNLETCAEEIKHLSQTLNDY